VVHVHIIVDEMNTSNVFRTITVQVNSLLILLFVYHHNSITSVNFTKIKAVQITFKNKTSVLCATTIRGFNHTYQTHIAKTLTAH